MGTANENNVIPFAMRDRSLTQRRGLDTVDHVEPLTTPRAQAGRAPAATPAAPAMLDASTLSDLFITSLDDMICKSQEIRSTPLGWPEQRDRHLEKVAVDVVTMLHDFIQEDPQVPQGIKRALDTLQMPMLQLAMRDVGFFADWRHPARQLLSSIPGLVQDYRDRGGRTEAFERHFEQRLGLLLDQLQPGVSAFAILLDELQVFANAGEIPQLGDEASAWERAEAASRMMLETALPPMVADFLADYWIDVLQQSALRHPEGSPQWLDAVAVIDDLAWSLAPKSDQSDRFQLIAEIPALLTRLNRGLDLIAIESDERRAFFDALATVHTALLKIDASHGAQPKAAKTESAIEQVARLQRGDWVEFYMSDGSHSRNRLTWISPQRGILVFGNQQGARAIQIAPDDLAEQIRGGKAMIIFDQPESATGKNSA